MKKLAKILMWTVVSIVAIAVVLLLTLPLWLGPTVKCVANAVVPSYTGTPFKMEHFHFNPYTGTLRIKGVRLSNPEGFGPSAAFSVDSVAVDFSVGELFSSKLHVYNAQIDNTFISYFSHEGVNNMDWIKDHAMAKLGGNKKEEGEEKAEEAAEEANKFRVVIDRLGISGTSIKLAETDLLPALPLPSIVLKDIGAESEDGATWEDVWNSIKNTLAKSGNTLAGNLKDFSTDLSDSAASGLGKAGEATANAAGATKDAVSGAISGTTDAVSDISGKAVDSVKDAANATKEGAKKLFKNLGL